jgi:hypothetical protein
VPRVITWLCHLSSRGCATCQSGFRISRFRGFHCHSSLHVETPIPETPMKPSSCHASTRVDGPDLIHSMAEIESGFRISRNRDFRLHCSLRYEIPNPELPMGSPGCHVSIQMNGPDLILELTVVIISRFRVSRFRGFH